MKFKANGWVLSLFIVCSVMSVLLCLVFGALTFVAWVCETDAIGRIFPTSLLFIMLTVAYGLHSFFFRKCYYSVEVNNSNAEICIHYPLKRKHVAIKFADIKGFSKTVDSTSTILENRSVTLYLLNGEKIDLSQYQFRQFSKFEQLLQTLPLTFLGTEAIKQDWLGNRVGYKY